MMFLHFTFRLKGLLQLRFSVLQWCYSKDLPYLQYGPVLHHFTSCKHWYCTLHNVHMPYVYYTLLSFYFASHRIVKQPRRRFFTPPQEEAICAM